MDKLVADFNKIMALIYEKEYAIFSLDELETKLDMKKKEIIEKHKEQYNIWQATDGRWKTKVPDSTKKNGERLLAKSKEEDLLNAIVEWYTKKEVFDTLETLFPEWIKFKAKDSSKGNANKLTWVWNTYYKDQPITKRKISVLKVLDVKTWLLDTIEEHSLTRKKYKEMKSVLNMMLDYAIELEIISNNVARNVRNISAKHFKLEEKKAIEENVYVDNEEEKLIDKCLEQFEKTRNIAYLAICMNTALGMRVGELVALKTSDFDDVSVRVQRQEIKIYEEQNGKYIRNGYCISEHTKTKESVRNIPLTSVSAYFYQMIVDINRSNAHKSEYLFLNENGERLHNDSINHALQRVNAKIGTVPKGNHCLRKQFISKLYNSGLLSDDRLREFAGHKYMSTTFGYIFPLETDKGENIIDYEKAVNQKNISVTKCNQKIEALKKAGNL